MMGRMRSRLEALDRLAEFYATYLAEDGQDGTNFDCRVLDAIKAIEVAPTPSSRRPDPKE